MALDRNRAEEEGKQEMTRKSLSVLVGTALVAAAVASVSGCAKHPKPSVEVETPPSTGQQPAEPPPATTPPATENPNAWKDQVRDVYFDYDKAELRSDARSALQGDAKFLKDHPDASVTLEGHCDERGTEEYNLALGQRRADAVRGYLSDLGVDASRLKTLSYGEEKPFDPGHTEDAWSQNRRVHFDIQ